MLLLCKQLNYRYSLRVYYCFYCRVTIVTTYHCSVYIASDVKSVQVFPGVSRRDGSDN